MIDISKLLAAGESSRLEFKSQQIRPDDLAKEIVAFLNFEGGRVLIGVEDDGTVSGISRADAEEWVVNICRNNVVPAILPIIEKLPYNDKIILVLEVPKGVARPYHTQKGDYYIRVGSTARKASREELFRLFQDSGMVHDEVTPIPNTSVRDLEPNTLHMQDYHYIEKVGRGVPMIVREMKRLARREPEFVESGEEFFVTLYKA